MRSLPATGRRLLQAVSTRHVRSVLSAGPLTTARLAPAKALASGVAVVAAGALLIPTGQAIAQSAHPDGHDTVTATAEGTHAQPQDFRLPVQGGTESEQAKTAKAAVVASLERDGGQGGAQDAQARQDEQASRDQQRTELLATEQQQSDEHADAEHAEAEHADAEQQSTDQQGGEQQQDAGQQQEQPQAEQAAAPAEQPAEQQQAAAPAAEPTPAPAPEPAKPSWSSPRRARRSATRTTRPTPRTRPATTPAPTSRSRSAPRCWRSATPPWCPPATRAPTATRSC
ncbi:hypothetical protein ACFQ2M_19005 [Kitasatospora saccharophila]|uniref:hypothetical protein n=1 Tax=Kitasatospora saccharophila TaxID=407973 RepID=UPI003639C6B2